MKNTEALNAVFTELEKISDQLGQLITSAPVADEGLNLVASQLRLAGKTLETLQKLDKAGEKHTAAVAEETIPVNLKEVVGMSFQHISPEVVKQEEPAPAPVIKKEEPVPAPVEIKSQPIVAQEPVKKAPAPADTALEDLKSMIGLNQKFAFIKLFGGDTTTWNDAIQQLNALTSYEESAVLLAEFRRKYGWDAEDEAVQSLTELVGRRYL